jgi:hypothetical protein
LALTAVTQADAQDRRRGERHTTVVIAPRGAHHFVQPARASVRYDSRRAYFDQRQDLEQIVRIAERWDRASANGDRHAQWKVDRRLDAWLEREIRESVRHPHNHRYTQRLRLLSDELAMLEQQKRHGRGYRGRGYGYRGHGYDGRGYEARGHRGYYGKKARILDELVMLSERQVQRAQANVPYAFRLSFAHR